MLNPPQAAVTLYLSGFLALGTGLELAPPRDERPTGALARGQARGELSAGVPRLDPRDGMANSALLMTALARVENPLASDAAAEACTAPPRSFALLLDGRLSRVRFSPRIVCQLRLLKSISVAQPGFGQRGLGEVAAFVLGRRVEGGSDVDVSRIVIPPFRFTGDTVNFIDADLGPLADGERFIGTYHTHPEGDLEQGVLSDVDLDFMRTGNADFHGRVGSLLGDDEGLDWLFDIVEPRDGNWNVYAHDRGRFNLLLDQCKTDRECPVNALRVTGSPFYLLVRYYDEPQPE